MAVEHPAKVDAVVNASGALHDFAIVAKTLAYGEDACEQKRRIDRRDFTIPASLASLCVQPVIKPAALMKSARVEEAERIACAFESFGFGDPASVSRDAERR